MFIFTKVFFYMTPQRSERLEEVLAKRQNDLTVVMENVFDPHNVAAIMRTCDAVGINEVFAITDVITLHKNWGYRSSRSANKWVALHTYSDRDTCIHDIRSKYDLMLASYIGEGVPSLHETDMTKKIALVFGNEKYGVSEPFRHACDGLFTIPQVGMIHSLNVSVACAVTLYEAFRQKTAKDHYIQSRLSAAEQDAIRLEWSDNQGKS
jgi:tRNA (guanosine-2'-O-)-methyltransferase